MPNNHTDPQDGYSILQPGTPTRSGLVAAAQQRVGAPYSLKPRLGYYNCFTLLCHVAKDNGLWRPGREPEAITKMYPRQPPQEFYQAILEANFDKSENYPRLGDVLFLYPQHSGIYVAEAPGRGVIIHASQKFGQVLRVELDAAMWQTLHSVWSFRNVMG